MKTYEMTTTSRLLPPPRSQHVGVIAACDLDDVQSSIRNVITTLSLFRDKFLLQHHSMDIEHTLFQLKKWIIDKPIISGLLSEKIERLETRMATNPCLIQNRFNPLRWPEYSEFIESLDMCQHVFFMEMAINETLVM